MSPWWCAGRFWSLGLHFVLCSDCPNLCERKRMTDVPEQLAKVPSQRRTLREWLLHHDLPPPATQEPGSCRPAACLCPAAALVSHGVRPNQRPFPSARCVSLPQPARYYLTSPERYRWIAHCKALRASFTTVDAQAIQVIVSCDRERSGSSIWPRCSVASHKPTACSPDRRYTAAFLRSDT